MDVNKLVLMQTGKHLSDLAEEARVTHELTCPLDWQWDSKLYGRYLRLARLSKEILEVANAD